MRAEATWQAERGWRYNRLRRSREMIRIRPSTNRWGHVIKTRLAAPVLFLSFAAGATEPWPRDARPGGTYVVAETERTIVVPVVALPDKFTLVVPAGFGGRLDWTFQEFSFGKGVTIDLSGGNGTDGASAPQDPPQQVCWGDPGTVGRSGLSGTGGSNGTSLDLKLGKVAKKGSLWIRTDGGSGGNGGAGQPGGAGGGARCDLPLAEHCSINGQSYRGCMGGGPGGVGGRGGNGGAGGAMSSVTIRWMEGNPAALTKSSCGTSCGPSARPNGFPSDDDGMIIVAGNPGCGGEGGAGGRGGDSGGSRPACIFGCASRAGPTGQIGGAGARGKNGTCPP